MKERSKAESLYLQPAAVPLTQYGDTIAVGMVAREPKYHEPVIRVFTSAMEGYAAQSIYVGTIAGIQALRDLCEQTLRRHDEQLCQQECDS